MTHLVAVNSPLSFIFKLVYGMPATCVLADAALLSKAGIIPGCGGGSILFAIEEQRLMQGKFNDPATSALYADDITTLGPQAYQALTDALRPKELAKLRVLTTNRASVPSQFHSVVIPACRLLGGYIGEKSQATSMFAADVKERLIQLVKVTMNRDISHQTKWALIKTIELGIRWKFAATNPVFTIPHAPATDEAIAKAVFCLADGEPTHKSRTLVNNPVVVVWASSRLDNTRMRYSPSPLPKAGGHLRNSSKKSAE